MKITLFELVLFLVLSTKPLLGAAAPAPEQVVDTSGMNVQAGAHYYIVSAFGDGGLGLASTNEDCPLDVVAVDIYLPVVFAPVKTKKGVICVHTDLNIYFNSPWVPGNCSQSTVWNLKFDRNGQRFVSTGGFLGNPGWKTLINWFKIEKYEDAYKLVFCPNVCGGCSYQCMDLGIYEDQYGKRLAMSNVPYKIKFQQAHIP